MKKIILSLLISLAFSLGSFTSLFAQEDFGNDIIVKNTPTENQRKVSLAVAGNGWIYAAFVTNSGSNSGYVVYKSTNNGQNWSNFVSSTSTTNTCDGVKVIVSGVAPYKVFVCKSRHENSTLNYHLYVSEYNGTTGAFVATPWEVYTTNWKIYDFDMAVDDLFPGNGTNPYSLGILYSRGGPSDSVKFTVSTNGGTSFTPEKTIKTSVNWFGKVSLAYGRCLNYNGGRYFAVWEEKLSFNAPLGRIGYARTGNGVNSAFITPIYLDNGTGIQNKCCNPKISCQFSGVNNDSINITSVVLVERWFANKNNDIIGWCNKKAATSNNWWVTTVENTNINTKQPDINFSSFHNGFFVAYWDSTNRYLPFVYQNFNMPTPIVWTMITPNYNNTTTSGSLLQPYPVFEANNSSNQYCFLWSREGTSNNGVAIFDASDNYTTILKNEIPKTNVTLFPNPTEGLVNLSFNGLQNELQLQLINTVGDVIYSVNFNNNNDETKTIDLSPYPNGIYYLKTISNKKVYVNKIVKN